MQFKLLSILLLVLSHYSITGQSYFNLDTCTIVNEKGQAVPNAVIEILNTPAVTTTNTEGKFAISKLPYEYRNYNLKVEHIAYQSTDFTMVDLLNERSIILKMRSYELNEFVVQPKQTASDISALKIIEQFIQTVPYRFSDSIYTQMGKFNYLSYAEISKDTLAYTNGVTNFILPQIFHNFQTYPNQETQYSTLIDRREQYLSSILPQDISPHIIIPYFCDYRIIDYCLNQGIIGDAFFLNKGVLGNYSFNITDSTIEQSKKYVYISFTPNEHKAFTFHGHIKICIDNYTIDMIEMKLSRHADNMFKSHVIGTSNVKLAIPVYDFHLHLDFSTTGTESTIKTHLKSAFIETTFSVNNPKHLIDTERICIKYEIPNFSPYKTTDKRLYRKNPNVLQKRIIKKVEKMIKELEER